MVAMLASLPWVVALPLTLLGGGLVGVFLYHFYLQLQLPGEVKVLWSWIPLLGHALELGQRPIEFLCDLAACGEDVVGVVIGGKRMFFVLDIFAAPIVFKTNSDYSHLDFHNLVLLNYFGVSPATVKNHVWDDDLMRKWFTQYLISDKPLQALTDRMERELREDIGCIKEGRFGLMKSLYKFIFKASTGAILNEKLAKDPNLLEFFMTFDNTMPLVLAGLPSSFFPAFQTARDVLTTAISTHREDNCELYEKRWAYFDKLCKEGKIQDKDGSRAQLAIFWASVSNTMPGTFWSVFHLLKSPVHLAKLEAEIKTIWPGFQQPNAPLCVNFDSLSQMVYLDACITETLRLVSGSLIMRSMHNACTVTLPSGKTIKFRKGDQLGMCPPVIHRDGKIYINPGTYNPDRWILPTCDPKTGVEYTFTERSNAANGRMSLFKDGVEIPGAHTFLAFGAGITYCPGRKFARNELKLLVVYLLHRLNLKLADPQCDTPGLNATRAGIGIFPPVQDVNVDITLRQ